MGKRNVPRGKTARQKRTTARREAVGVSKAQNPATTEEHGTVEDAIAAVARTFSLPARRRAARAALTAAGVAEPAVLPTFETTRGSLVEHWFTSKAHEAGFTEMGADYWPTEAEAIDATTGEAAFRDGEHEAVYELGDGTLAFVSVGHGSAHVRTAGPTEDGLAAAHARFRGEYLASYVVREDGEFRIPITFWTLGRFGPSARLRRIESASWEDIEANYTAAVRDELARLMEWSAPESDGQLLLWQGPPGTGKTWALRALAAAWAPWAEFHFITDPDSFFVKDPSYMIDVLLSDSYEAIDAPTGDVYSETDAGGKWRVLILEDTGELLAANAKESYGQGLSRLLNVVDGMVGQGLRVLALVTTNDELGDLHPAVSRPGRCASQIEFGPLTAEEATAWIGEPEIEIADPLSLAELYALAGRPAADATFAAEDPEEVTPEQALAAVEEAFAASTCECGHPFSDHLGEEGPCTFEDDRGTCSCASFAKAAITAAGGPTVVWDEEEGFYDLIGDLAAALNPGDSYRWYVADVALSADRAILCDYETQETWLAPFAIGDDKEPTLAPQSEWTAVESAWVTDDDGNLTVSVGEFTILRIYRGTIGTFSNAANSGYRVSLTDMTFSDAALPAELQPGETLPERNPSPSAPAAPAAPGGELRWTSTIAPEGALTDDGRAFAPGAISWRQLPLSLMAQLATDDGHDGAVVCGRIDAIWREGDVLKASGVFDSGEFGKEIARLVGEGTLRGVSVDLAVLQHEVGPRSDYFDEDGNWIFGTETATAEDTETSDADRLVDMLFGGEDAIFVVTEAKIGAVTVCSFPAFEDASIQLAASLVAGAAPDVWTVRSQAGWTVVARPGTDGGDGAPALTASAAGIAPDVPPAAWFDDPAFDGPTALIVDDDGRVSGHAALWDTCHIGIPDVCTTAPHSRTGYAYFHLKEVVTAEGEAQRVPVGTITLATGHADRHLGRAAAAAHYDDTGLAVADVRVGEDEYGIWFAGALRPDVDEDKARELRGAVLSGDWRDVDGNLELVALLAVNVPGFPVPRAPAALVASANGEQRVVALVSAGLNLEAAKSALSEEQLAELAALTGRTAA